MFAQSLPILIIWERNIEMSKKVLSFILVLALLVSLAACAGKAAEPSETASSVSDSPAPEATQTSPEVSEEVSESASTTISEDNTPVSATANFPLFDEPTTLTIWCGSSPDLSEIIKEFSDYLIIAEMEKLTNVHWEATLVSFTAVSEMFNLMVASQEYCDVVNEGSANYNGGTDLAIEEEFIIDLKPYIDDYMPNLLQWFSDNEGLEKELTSTNGAIGAFPKLNALSNLGAITQGGMMRLDWLEELGMDIPETFDDMYNILTAFKTEKNADGALMLTMNTGVQDNLIYGYNMSASTYQIDGVVHYGAIEDAFKDYLTMINKWYTEGLISEAFLTNQNGMLQDYSPIYTGRTGIWYGSSVQYMSTIDSNIDESVNYGGFTDVTLDGSKAHIGEAGYIFGGNSWSITTACQCPEKVAMYVDYFYGEEGIMLCNYGVEGYTFNYDDDGIPYLTEVVTNNPDMSYTIALNVYTCDRQTQIPFVVDQTKAYREYTDRQKQAVEAWNENNDGLYNMPRNGMNMTDEENEETTNLMSDIETYYEENVTKFVTGDRPLSEFDDFVSQMKVLGIDRIVEITQAAYDRYLTD